MQIYKVWLVLMENAKVINLLLSTHDKLPYLMNTRETWRYNKISLLFFFPLNNNKSNNTSFALISLLRNLSWIISSWVKIYSKWTYSLYLILISSVSGNPAWFKRTAVPDGFGGKYRNKWNMFVFEHISIRYLYIKMIDKDRSFSNKIWYFAQRICQKGNQQKKIIIRFTIVNWKEKHALII